MARTARNSAVERIVLSVCFGAAAIGLAVVAYSGAHYYRLPAHERVYSNAHAIFGSAGTVGFATGLTALVLFSYNFAYLLRKTLHSLRGIGTLRGWLNGHVAAAIIGCGYVALHANFEMRNWIARTCVYALIIVTTTGLIGRYLLRFVPRTASGRRADLAAFEDELMELIDDIRPDIVHDHDAVIALQAMVDSLETDEAAASLRDVRARLGDAHQRMRVLETALARSEEAHRHRWKAARMRRGLARMSRQIAVFGVAGRVMDAWRAFHRAFALLLLVAIAAHVAIALYYGYGASL